MDFWSFLVSCCKQQRNKTGYSSSAYLDHSITELLQVSSLDLESVHLKRCGPGRTFNRSFTGFCVGVSNVSCASRTSLPVGERTVFEPPIYSLLLNFNRRESPFLVNHDIQLGHRSVLEENTWILFIVFLINQEFIILRGTIISII